MIFLDFEQPLEKLHEQLEKVRAVSDDGVVDMQPTITELEERIKQTRRDIYSNLNGWQRVQLSRHPERPYTLYYIEQMCRKFVELHGDRCFGDDKAVVGGIGEHGRADRRLHRSPEGRQYENAAVPQLRGWPIRRATARPYG